MAGIPLGAAHPTVAGSLNYAPVQGIPLGQAHPTVVANLNPAPKPAAAPAPPGGGGGGGGLIYGGGGGVPAPVYAPKLDVSALYTNARNQGNADANQYYNTQLSQFITQQAQAKAIQQQQTATDIKNLQDVLAQTQSQNATSGARSAEDTALAEQNIAQTADQRQLDQGSAFDISRNQQAQKEAQSGLAGSGLAAGAEAGAQQSQDLTESRQAQADQQSKTATELAKARTFEDLATSNKLAGETETKGETQANFDLSKFIQGQSNDLTNQTNQLQLQRQSQALSAAQNYAKLAYASYLNNIANPAQKVAAAQQYGGLF